MRRRHGQGRPRDQCLEYGASGQFSGEFSRVDADFLRAMNARERGDTRASTGVLDAPARAVIRYRQRHAAGQATRDPAPAVLELLSSELLRSDEHCLGGSAPEIQQKTCPNSGVDKNVSNGSRIVPARKCARATPSLMFAPCAGPPSAGLNLVTAPEMPPFNETFGEMKKGPLARGPWRAKPSKSN